MLSYQAGSAADSEVKALPCCLLLIWHLPAHSTAHPLLPGLHSAPACWAGVGDQHIPPLTSSIGEGLGSCPCSPACTYGLCDVHCRSSLYLDPSPSFPAPQLQAPLTKAPSRREAVQGLPLRLFPSFPTGPPCLCPFSSEVPTCSPQAKCRT